ncbi:hypothetical protein [Rhizobium sp. RAF56]|uniref:hypothetical protein n=1 Tax=Rhizobium sp. RAF56 TaxID=3233062 RepID=UPI003F97AE89
MFRVGGVEGFYAEWSPSISTDSIKVLTADKEHKVEIPDGCEIQPWRLGKVSEAELYLYQSRELQKPAPSEDATPAVRQEEQAAEAAVPAQQFSRGDDRALKLLASLRTVAWVIVGLLVLVVMRLR